MLLVVDTGVKAQFVRHVGALVRPTGNAHHPAATGLGQRTKRTAHRATGGGDDHRLTRLGVDDLDQAVPGGHPGHTHCTEVMRQRHVGGVHLLQRARHRRIHHAVLLPAAKTHNLVTHGVFGVLALDHLPHRAALEHLAHGLRGGITLGVVHTTAHVRVQAHVMVAHQHFVGLEWCGLRRHQFEIAGHGFALGAVVENDLLVGGHGASWKVWLLQF